MISFPIYINHNFNLGVSTSTLSKVFKTGEVKPVRNSPPEVFCKKDVLRNFQNSQESTCGGVFSLIKLQAWSLLKDRLWHRCFPVNFWKFLRISFLTEQLWWLLLKCIKKNSRTDKENYFQTSQKILEQIKNITDQSESR